jgi:DNA-binding NarL/FixJ family response regulator
MDTSEHRIRVLVAEDNPDLAAAICELIAAESDMQVEGATDHVGDLVAAVASSAARVLVLDLNLHGESSVPALLQVRGAHPDLAVVVYSGHDRRDLGSALGRVGRCEYVAKTGDPAELIGAIRRAAHEATGAGA